MKNFKPTAAFCIFLALTGTIGATEICSKVPKSNLIVNVKEHGARGDGLADDSIAIQSAVSQVAGTGGTVLIPDGIYMVDAVIGIRIASDTNVRLTNGAIIKAIPNDKTNYSIFKIFDASNVTVIGGTLFGERDDHMGVAGEWGMGIFLRGATNVVIENVTAKNTWGDGFYVSGLSRNIKFCSVTADNNRRQGMSIISVDGISVVNSVFSNTGGTAPQAGIDIEPNAKDSVSNVRIINSKFVNNKGLGIQIYLGVPTENYFVKNVTIDGNYLVGNRGGGIGIWNTSGNHIINNIIRDNPGGGIILGKNTKANSVAGNRIVGQKGIRDLGDNLIVGNDSN